MTHLTMEQLLALREPGLEPGVRGWREHVEACEACRAELERLDQRIARLRALPVLRPPRSRFAEARSQTGRWRLRRRLRVVTVSGLALAATVALGVVLVPAFQSGSTREALTQDQELDEVIARSRQLEDLIQSLDPDRGVTDGRAALVAATLEDRVARLDRQLQLINLGTGSTRSPEALELWRERVGLLDALVDVHATGARFVRY
ncbi:MAG TPA: hypothetical protein VI383_10455 [Gemmatimonadales bacterium]|nr:hypothetical protein [Gemmatimonadales bacterium]